MPVVWEDETVVVKHLLGPMPIFLGHLVVETRRHAVCIDGTTDEEAAATGRAVRRAALALRAVFDVEQVHAAVINTGYEHFHQHVYPRHRGTPSDYRWHDTDAWTGAPHGDTDAVEQLCSRLRPHFLSRPRDVGHRHLLDRFATRHGSSGRRS